MAKNPIKQIQVPGTTPTTYDIQDNTLVAGTNTTITNNVDGTRSINATDTNTATAADNILDGSNSGTQITYAPYNSTVATSTWVSNSNNAGKIYLGTVDPVSTTRVNLNADLHTKKINTDEVKVSNISIIPYLDSASMITTSHNYGLSVGDNHVGNQIEFLGQRGSDEAGGVSIYVKNEDSSLDPVNNTYDFRYDGMYLDNTKVTHSIVPNPSTTTETLGSLTIDGTNYKVGGDTIYKYAIPIRAEIQTGGNYNSKLLILFTLKGIGSLQSTSSSRLHFYLETSGDYDHYDQTNWCGPYLEIRKGAYNSSRTSQTLIARVYNIQIINTTNFETEDSDEDFGDYWYGYFTTQIVTVFGRYYDELENKYGWMAKWDSSWSMSSPEWTRVTFKNKSDSNGATLTGMDAAKQSLHWFEGSDTVTYTGKNNS